MPFISHRSMCARRSSPGPCGVTIGPRSMRSRWRSRKSSSDCYATAPNTRSCSAGGRERLRAFRDRERAMNEALVAAQQLRVDSREQSEREAELVLREARAEAERILARAHQDEGVVRERADGVARQFTTYIAR